MIKNNATPTFLNYGGFPKNICISVNDELIHGIPNERIIKDKDMVTFDIGVTYQNHVCDSAFTIIIGENKEAEKINKATLECLYSTIDIIKPGVRVGDLGNMTQTIAKKNGYEVIKDFSGHGCGNFLHEDPPIFNFGMKGQGIKLVKNMIICIEPMLLTDSDEYFIDKKNN
jgi:methionyl aminopeptidase